MARLPDFRKWGNVGTCGSYPQFVAIPRYVSWRDTSRTVHLALGQGFPDMGGTNVSSIHWDIVKDLHAGGRLYVDGELVQENGAWLI